MEAHSDDSRPPHAVSPDAADQGGPHTEETSTPPAGSLNGENAALRAALLEMNTRLEGGPRRRIRIGRGTLQVATLIGVFVFLGLLFSFGQVRPRIYPRVDVPDLVALPSFGMRISLPDGFQPVAGQAGRWERGEAWMAVHVRKMSSYPQPVSPVGGATFTSVLYARDLAKRYDGEEVGNVPAVIGKRNGADATVRVTKVSGEERIRAIAVVSGALVREVVFGGPEGAITEDEIARTIGSLRLEPVQGAVEAGPEEDADSDVPTGSPPGASGTAPEDSLDAD
ncbi:MAG: hypothetical protein ACOCX4_04510 [Planctomycetota bacterium]